MKYLEATSSKGHKIQVQAVMQKIDVTPLDAEFGKQWEEVLAGVLVEGQHVELYLDGSFHHPLNEQIYTINY